MHRSEPEDRFAMIVMSLTVIIVIGFITTGFMWSSYNRRQVEMQKTTIAHSQWVESNQVKQEGMTDRTKERTSTLENIVPWSKK